MQREFKKDTRHESARYILAAEPIHVYGLSGCGWRGRRGGAEAETKARTDEGIKVEGQAETGIKAGRDGETGDIYGRGKRQGGVNEETDRGERKSNSQSDNPSKQ